jgi:hypothetical protein
MNRRNGLLVGALLLLGGVGQTAEKKAATAPMLDGKKIELARYAKAFIGEGNVTVEIAPYKKDGKDGAILLFKGVEGPWDGKAIDHRINYPNRDGKDYVTTYDGKEWHTLVQRKYHDMTYQLNLPEVSEAIKLAPSDGAAQLTSPDEILRIYNEQAPERTKQ